MTAAHPKSDASSATTQDGKIPAYLSSRSSGVFIDLGKFSSVGGFDAFVNQMFSGDSRFFELDYDVFQKLLYDPDWLETTKKKSTEIRIAAGILRFPSQRRALYRAVKLLDGGKQAEYLFEPVMLEEVVEEPAREPIVEGNVVPIDRQKSKTRQMPAKLDFDEFVADMWGKGVKYGIDADSVRKFLAKDATGRLIFANFLAQTTGSDADIQEVCGELRRDNSPKTKLDGKADLRAFKNRFPHISKGGRLLKKIPRKLGKPGYLVTGEVIEPTIPKDIDFSALTSRGTAVVQNKDGEFIVATMDGFLTIDTASNVISISEKIETDAGISMKTTGDLMLVVEEFIEHGEVQEGRVVKGKHMTFTGDVFGELISSGGNIRVEGNLSGGRAETADGNIELGRALRAVASASTGRITAQYCENCTIIAREIHIERAINCEIIGAEVCVDVVEGCTIAAESLKVGSSSESRNRETSITMLIPDLSAFDRSIAELQKKISECKSGIADMERGIALLNADPDFVRYLAINEKVKSGEIKLANGQLGAWRQLVVRNAEAAARSEKLLKQTAVFERIVKESEEELAKVTMERDATGENIRCDVYEVRGQAIGHSMKSVNGVKGFEDMHGSEIKAILQTVDSKKSRLFSQDEGLIHWSYR